MSVRGPGEAVGVGVGGVQARGEEDGGVAEGLGRGVCGRAGEEGGGVGTLDEGGEEGRDEGAGPGLGHGAGGTTGVEVGGVGAGEGETGAGLGEEDGALAGPGADEGCASNWGPIWDCIRTEAWPGICAGAIGCCAEGTFVLKTPALPPLASCPEGVWNGAGRRLPPEAFRCRGGQGCTPAQPR